MPVRLVVGLGNPGKKYADSRHNLGFQVLDRFIPDASDWKNWKASGAYGEADIAGRKIMLARPLKYMNLSGQMVSDFANYFRIQPSEILICYDDFALNMGQLRIRVRGSAGGHNGMKSLIESLGTQDIPRLRIGIGPLPPGRDAAHFVLEKVDSATRAQIGEAVDRAVDAVRTAVAEDLETAMNRFNTVVKAEP